MIIISQNKETIVNFDNIDSISVIEYKEDRWDVCVFNGSPDSQATIGSYSTKERAIWMVQRIVDSYVFCHPTITLFDDEEIEDNMKELSNIQKMSNSHNKI